MGSFYRPRGRDRAVGSGGYFSYGRVADLEVLAHITTATTMYREMDMRFWLEQAKAVTIDPVGGV